MEKIKPNCKKKKPITSVKHLRITFVSSGTKYEHLLPSTCEMGESMHFIGGKYNRLS